MEDANALATPEEIEQARTLYSTENVEIDATATASRADDGAWIAAWVWVPNG